jgi:hypothetical protein
VRLVSASVDAPPKLGFGIYYGVSVNSWRFWEIATAADDIGYVPRDNAEMLR